MPWYTRFYAYNDDELALHDEKKEGIMSDVTKLLDGKWEPNEYIRDMRSQCERIDRVIESYIKQQKELRAEIERAKCFIAESTP
jgi:phage shock protein A